MKRTKKEIFDEIRKIRITIAEDCEFRFDRKQAQDIASDLYKQQGE